MTKKAFRMTLYPGAISYSIFLDSKSNTLFGYLEIEDEEKWALVPTTAINRKWWTYMKDLMETNTDDSPISHDLEQVFEL
ncbi:L-rhamnose mutarotase [Enterococcus sp. DIV0756]|uniref:L-rhamnose mutarotase n=1 Tax=Enterococcus sp. DIV0756 TaxID=2774636 RepID=UPI003F2023F5